MACLGVYEHRYALRNLPSMGKQPSCSDHRLHTEEENLLMCKNAMYTWRKDTVPAPVCTPGPGRYLCNYSQSMLFQYNSHFDSE